MRKGPKSAYDKWNISVIIVTQMFRNGSQFKICLISLFQCEIEKVLQLGVDPSRIIFANPCKQKSFIRYAAKSGVMLMTFDNKDELLKIKQYHASSRCFC